MDKEPESEQESPLAAFEKTLPPEEAVLIADYVNTPTLEMLSKTFDLILKEEEKIK